MYICVLRLCFIFFFQMTIQADDKATDLEVGNGLLYGYVNRRNLLGNLAGDSTSAITYLICLLIGPDFLQQILSSNKCPSGIELPNLFHSYKDFCAFYNNACPEVQDCLTNAAVEIKTDLYGIYGGDLVLAKCCKYCDSNSHIYSAVGGDVGSDLLSAELLNNNLATTMVNNIGDGLNTLICSFLGPDFPQFLLNSKECTSGLVLPNAFHSVEHFCALYNRSSQTIKNCFTDAAVRINVDLDIDRGGLDIGKCCTYCA